MNTDGSESTWAPDWLVVWLQQPLRAQYFPTCYPNTRTVDPWLRKDKCENVRRAE